MDPGQGLHFLEGAAEISCSQRNEASSKKSVPGSGRERYCFALHPSYFSNAQKSYQNQCPVMAVIFALAGLDLGSELKRAMSSCYHILARTVKRREHHKSFCLVGC